MNQGTRTLAALKGISIPVDWPKYKARMETVCGLLNEVAEATPSKLVEGTLGGEPTVI